MLERKFVIEKYFGFQNPAFYIVDTSKRVASFLEIAMGKFSFISR